MEPETINHFESFCCALHKAGFSMGSGNDEGIFTLCTSELTAPAHFGVNIAWHTGNPETDPWEWRIRVLNERDDIAYSKLFFKKSGYITRDWYPYFLAARRCGGSFTEAYQNGTISSAAKRIYEQVEEGGILPLHIIKQRCGFSGSEKSLFDRALTELQMRMFITMCGSEHKFSARGTQYGWNSTAFCLTETFFEKEVFEKAAAIPQEAAAAAIGEQIILLNKNVVQKNVSKFIYGR